MLIFVLFMLCFFLKAFVGEGFAEVHKLHCGNRLYRAVKSRIILKILAPKKYPYLNKAKKYYIIFLKIEKTAK